MPKLTTWNEQQAKMYWSLLHNSKSIARREKIKVSRQRETASTKTKCREGAISRESKHIPQKMILPIDNPYKKP